MLALDGEGIRSRFRASAAMGFLLDNRLEGTAGRALLGSIGVLVLWAMAWLLLGGDDADEGSSLQPLH